MKRDTKATARWFFISLVTLVLSSDLIIAIDPGRSHAKADWPEFRGNQQRTSYSSQRIEAKHWSPNWTSSYFSQPQPAWPAPAKASLWQKLSTIEARVTDDASDVPLLAKDRNGKLHLLVASSANDRLVSFDVALPKIHWEYVANAPIRYAPSIQDGIAYVGSDDGHVVAIDISNGKIIWRAQIGPAMPWIVGNNRLISPHPIRTGVMAVGDHVFATAGLFPSQGVYAVALNRKDGSVIWRRRIQKSPQGYLLSTPNERIYVPSGRAKPFALDAETGRVLFDLPSPGGSFCMLTPDAFFAGPGNKPNVQVKPNAKGAKMLSFGGRQVAAGAGMIWTANGTKLTCVAADSLSKKTLEPRWSVDCKGDQALTVCGDERHARLFVAHGNKIEVFDAIEGKKIAELETSDKSDQIRYVAVSKKHGSIPETIAATTMSGRIYTWKGGPTKPLTDRFTQQREEINDHLDSLIEKRVRRWNAQLKCDRGWALLINENQGEITSSLLRQTNLNVAVLLDDPKDVRKLQNLFQVRKTYGHRVSVQLINPKNPLPYAPGLFNLVVERKPSSAIKANDLRPMLVQGSGIFFDSKNQMTGPIRNQKGHGTWRHQYGSLSNQADGQDELVGSAGSFRLQWFGGVGPSRMPDRHLRGPSPLAAKSSMVLQGDGVLIGVDPANGTERWQLKMPERAMRYVTPYDGPYSCLTANGEQLFVSARSEIWNVDAFRGTIHQKFSATQFGEDLVWGYLAESNRSLFATLMKPSAPRTALDTKTRYTFVNSDYNSDRPLVTSRHMVRLTTSGKKYWKYSPGGIILNSAIAFSDDHSRVFLVVGKSQDCLEHKSDRIPLPVILQDAELVCLNASDGSEVWKKPLVWADAKNMLYVQTVDDQIVLTSSKSLKGKAKYLIRVLSFRDGSLSWQAEHDHVKGGLFHGEQVHHPVILHRPNGQIVLVAEPFFYDMKTGKRVLPEGAESNWAIRRPGHSCGTLTGSGNCLFFRASNPTVLNLGVPGGKSFTALAPTRAGCWINMIPACGKLLIPEGSASCVCQYSLQTSMAFEPLREKNAIPILEDIENQSQSKQDQSQLDQSQLDQSKRD